MADAKIKPSQLFDDFAEELLSERGVRPLIIIGASKIEQLQLELLSTFLLPKRVKAKEQDELLEGDTPLGTFSARIKICHRLGLIDEELCATLELLRKIRNGCRCRLRGRAFLLRSRTWLIRHLPPNRFELMRTANPGRRYSMLFAVNGAAFAVAKLGL